MSVKSLSDQQNPKFLKKRITLKYIDEEQMELFFPMPIGVKQLRTAAVGNIGFYCLTYQRLASDSSFR